MYFYQQNFIYDVSSYNKIKDTNTNRISILNINISDFEYYISSANRPRILLSTGNFSPWGARDVLIGDTWFFSYIFGAGVYVLEIYISNTNIDDYDINQIKYLIFLDDTRELQINSNEKNFSNLKLKNNTQLRIEFNNGITKDYILPVNTSLSKKDTYIDINPNHQYSSYTRNFSSNAQQEINLSADGYNNFPHFINLKLQRPTNTTVRVLRLRLIVIDRNNTTHILQTYYFSSFSGQTLNTFNVVPYLTGSLYELNNNSTLRLNLAWTSDGNTLTTENTTVEVQCIWFLPTNNFRIYF
jgi:hypothetical protein